MFIFSCFHHNVPFKLTSYTLLVLVLDFCVSCLNLKLGLLLSWLVHVLWNNNLDNFCAHSNNKEIFLQIFTNLTKKGFVIKSYS